MCATLKIGFKIAGEKDIYISGGAKLYDEAIPIVEKMYITEIDCEANGDTFLFFYEKLFDKEINKKVEDEISFTYVTYIGKKIIKKILLLIEMNIKVLKR